MTEHEDFIIQEPYQPNENEKQAIAKLEAKGLVAKDWDSQRRYIKSFKKNLREFTYNKQNQLCAYCRIHVPKACVPMHREHIVYKDKHPQWMFLPNNLSVACPYCNDFKGTTEVLKNPKTKTYPKTSKGFKIIHPFFDRYSDHIELLGGIIYHGKTPKGVFTIQTCHLYRIELAEERIYQKLFLENPGDIIVELSHLLTLSSQYEKEINELIEYVKTTVKDYKKKRQL